MTILDCLQTPFAKDDTPVKRLSGEEPQSGLMHIQYYAIRVDRCKFHKSFVNNADGYLSPRTEYLDIITAKQKKKIKLLCVDVGDDADENSDDKEAVEDEEEAVEDEEEAVEDEEARALRAFEEAVEILTERHNRISEKMMNQWPLYSAFCRADSKLKLLQKSLKKKQKK